MAVDTSPRKRDLRTFVRAVLVPFILGLAAPTLALAAGQAGSAQGFLGGLMGLDEFLMVMLVGTPVAGFIASAAAGRDHGWLGFVSAAAGIVAGVAAGVLWIQVRRTDGGDPLMGTVSGAFELSFLFWVPLGIGYAAHRVVRTWVAAS